MTDTLCGPSNALRTFQKHASVDRTLQQDRFIPHHSAQESFRSAPGPETRSVDAEFEAFQSSAPLQIGYPEPQGSWNVPVGYAAQEQLHQPRWATNFRDLSLNVRQPLQSSSHTTFRQQSRPEQPVSQSWQQDFLREQRASSQANASHMVPSQMTSAYQTPFAPHFVQQQPLNDTYNPIANGNAPRSELQSDDAMFEKAFDSLMGSASETTQNNSHEPYSQQTAVPPEVLPYPENIFHEGPASQGTIPLEQPQQEPSPIDATEEADELAKTAGNLLDSVAGDQTQKFKQSNFLSLMRQLRDREVKVDGDKLVETTAQPLHPGGTNYPHNANEFVTT